MSSLFGSNSNIVPTTVQANLIMYISQINIVVLSAVVVHGILVYNKTMHGVRDSVKIYYHPILPTRDLAVHRNHTAGLSFISIKR